MSCVTGILVALASIYALVGITVFGICVGGTAQRDGKTPPLRGILGLFALSLIAWPIIIGSAIGKLLMED